MSFFPHNFQNTQILHQYLLQLQAFCLRRYTTRSRQSRFIVKNRPAFSNRFVKNNVPLLDEIVQPQKVPVEKHVNVELKGVQSKLSRQLISSILDRFSRDSNIRELASTQNITKNIFHKAFQSFRLHCCSGPDLSRNLDPGLQVIFSDIINYDQSTDLIYPYFLQHAHKVFPHLERINELKQISDLTQPHNWYPLAREIHRKIIFHAGPTNSGKTYEALEAFKKAKSGMYCGPLRLLALEIYERVNKDGIIKI